MIRADTDPEVIAERGIRDQFDRLFVQLPDAIRALNLSAQYGRQMILDHGIPEQDYFTIANRYFVSTHFLTQLLELREAQNRALCRT